MRIPTSRMRCLTLGTSDAERDSREEKPLNPHIGSTTVNEAESHLTVILIPDA